MAVLLLTLLAVVLAVANAELTQHLHSLADNCEFTLNGSRFDLCPVLRADKSEERVIAFEKWTPPTVTRTEYRISFGGALKRNESRETYEQCYEGSQICLTVTNRRPKHDDEAPRITSVVPVAGNLNFEWESEGKKHSYSTHMNASVSLGETVKSRHPAVKLRLGGGLYVRDAQNAVFYFTCNHTAEEPTSPEFAWRWGGTHGFTWLTKHACGQSLTPHTSTMQATPVPPTQTPQPEPEPETPPEQEEDPEEPPPPPEGEERNFIPPADDGRKRSATVIFFAVLSPIVLLTYLFYSPPPALRRLVLRLRPARFRTKESRLLRWAEYEGLEGEGEGEGEEDFMVNSGMGVEERIPLAPSPRKGKWAGYGSAG